MAITKWWFSLVPFSCSIVFQYSISFHWGKVATVNKWTVPDRVLNKELHVSNISTTTRILSASTLALPS